MHPVLFEVGGITVYSYGFLIALGAIAGVAYMAVQGKKEVGLTFDQANTLFLFIFVAAFAGGPAVGVAAIVAQKLLNDPFNKLIAYEYDITGTWDDPQEVKTKSDKPAAATPLGQ